MAYGWQIPIHMVYPRLFTCPTVSARTFKVVDIPPTPLGTAPMRYSPKFAELGRSVPQVEFEVNLVFLFTDGHLLTENFPVKLVRM